MSSCSGCINETEEMKYIGLHKCKIGLATKTRLIGACPINEKVEEIEECNEYRTATIEEAIRYLSDGNDGNGDIEKSLKALSERDDIDCPALKDPYNFEGCWEFLAVCCNFDECEKIFGKVINTGE